MRIWLQLEFSWIAYGFIHAVSENYADEFDQQLRRLGFVVANVSAPSKEDMIRGIRASLDLPESCDPPNWDSLIDCLRDFEWPARFALVLRGVDAFAAGDPQSFGEACAVLTRAFEGHGSEQKQFELVITGRGPGFHDPSHPSAERALDDERNTPVAIERRRRRSAPPD